MQFHKIILASAIASFGVWTSPAFADYPNKPVTLVVPYGPGGAADLAARIIGNEAPEYLGENILVVNQAGAGGIPASTRVAKGKPDGYTLLMARVGSQATVPAMNETIPYTWDEFTFLGLVETNPFVVAVSTDSPYKSFEDLASAIKSGERLTYSSAGVGTLQHMGALILLDELGVEAGSQIHVPFNGGGEATTGVVAGNADFVIHNMSALIGAIGSKQIQPLLITTKERSSSIPNTPTAAEAGYPGLEAVVGWSGVWGPEKMPKEAADKWVDVLNSLSTDESWITSTEKLGSNPQILSPADTKAMVEAQYTKFRTVADKLGMVIR